MSMAPGISKGNTMPEIDKNLLGGKYDYVEDSRIISEFTVGEVVDINGIKMQVYGVSAKFVVLAPTDDTGYFKKPDDK